MAKKEKSYNPAQEQHKKDKKRAAERQKQQRQNVSLAHTSRKNPARLESQIASLKQMDQAGRLSDTDRQLLITLEKEVRTIKKAKTQFTGQTGPIITSDRTKGDETERIKLQAKEEKRAFKEVLNHKRNPKRSVYYDEVYNIFGMPPPGMPWKELDEDDSDGWSTDSEVRRIPMPRDTPPATKKPKEKKPDIKREKTPPRTQPAEKIPEPIAPKEGPSDSVDEAFLRAGATVIEAAPVIRDFQKEAVAIVPSIVKKRPPPRKQAKILEEPVAEKKEVEIGEAEKAEAAQKSFATTVEDGEDVLGKVDIEETFIAETTLKRPLETEKKVEEIPAAPPKRRKRLNAAPDV